MPRILVLIDTSCIPHPLCKVIPPAVVSLEVVEKELFLYGSLWLEDSEIGRRGYRQTKRLWDTLHRQYKSYLRYTPKQITAKASGEPLTRLSEIVGIGCGLIALTTFFDVQINRLTRYTPPGKGRRLDFEWCHNGSRYFHECKGTTYPKRWQSVYADIVTQKAHTVARCKKSGPSVAAASGSITLYRHTTRKEHLTQVLLVDPPVEHEHDVEPPRYWELARVLRHYQGFVAVTHHRRDGPLGWDLASWLASVVRELERGGRPPDTAPLGMTTTARQKRDAYEGTVFDVRATRWAAQAYADFGEATTDNPDPATFVGVSSDVIRMLVNCEWQELLNYKDPLATRNGEGSTTVVLPSGVAALSVERDEDHEKLAHNSFTLNKRSILRRAP